MFEANHDVMSEMKIITKLHWEPEDTELEIQSLCLWRIRKASPFVSNTGIKVGMNAAKKMVTRDFKKTDLKENLD